jgi:cytidylate kinase
MGIALMKGLEMRILTISRQVGSLGDVIAALAARRLEMKLIGPEQIKERANTCDAEYSDACSLYESERGPGFFERLFFETPAYTSLFESLTYEFAAEGDVVIIGRGSQFVLQNIPGVVKVRVVADTPIRVSRIKERFGISHDEAVNYVKKYDNSKRTLLQSVFEQDPTDLALFDMILNTSHFTADGATGVVCEAVNSVDREHQSEDLKQRLNAMAIAKTVETVIKKRLSTGVAWQIRASGDPGVEITLEGRVRDRRNKEKAERIASEHSQVSSVINNIKVTDLSFGF